MAVGADNGKVGCNIDFPWLDCITEEMLVVNVDVVVAYFSIERAEVESADLACCAM